LLIGINEALQLPRQMLALDVDTVQLFLELPLLPALDVLPQGIFLQNDLRVLEQLTDEGPHQGIETVGADTTGGATLYAPHGYGVLAGTAIIALQRHLAHGFSHTPLLDVVVAHCIRPTWGPILPGGSPQRTFRTL